MKDSGGQCVIMTGMRMMLESYAGNCSYPVKVY